MKQVGNLKIGFSGGGKMAEAIIKGLAAGGRKHLFVYDLSSGRMNYLKKQYRVTAVSANRELAGGCDVLVLAVKPGDLPGVCAEIKGVVSGKPVISIAAGVALSRLRDLLGSDRVVRTMPNTPAFIGKGMTVIASSPQTLKKDIALASDIFSVVGDVLVMDEKFLNAVTAVSGSGPAFVSLFIESMVDGAVRIGIPREQALRLALKTAEGTIGMLLGGLHTAHMREMVTSPGGTTAEGLSVLDNAGFKGIIGDAVKSTCDKASSLSK